MLIDGAGIPHAYGARDQLTGRNWPQVVLEVSILDLIVLPSMHPTNIPLGME